MKKKDPNILRVLICDDDEIFQEILTRKLRMYRYEVVGNAFNGLESINQFVELRPDIILLDINMPKGGGLTVLRFIRELDPNVFTIMLTQDASLHSVQTALKLGANDYQTKKELQYGEMNNRFLNTLSGGVNRNVQIQYEAKDIPSEQQDSIESSKKTSPKEEEKKITKLETHGLHQPQT